MRLKKSCQKYAVLLILSLSFYTSVIHAQENKYPTETIEPLYGLNYTAPERDSLLNNLKDYQKAFEALHQYKLNNAVPMSLIFDPLPVGFQVETNQKTIDWGLSANVTLPVNREELAFYPVHKLAVLIKSKKLTSVELTQLYLNRIKKYRDTLQCVITILEERALAEARKADEEIAKGKIPRTTAWYSIWSKRLACCGRNQAALRAILRIRKLIRQLRSLKN